MSRVPARGCIPFKHRPLPLVLTKQFDAADRPLRLVDDRLQDALELIGHSLHHGWIKELAVVLEGAGQSVTLDNLKCEIQLGHTRIDVHILNLEASQLR